MPKCVVCTQTEPSICSDCAGKAVSLANSEVATLRLLLKDAQKTNLGVLDTNRSLESGHKEDQAQIVYLRDEIRKYNEKMAAYERKVKRKA